MKISWPSTPMINLTFKCLNPAVDIFREILASVIPLIHIRLLIADPDVVHRENWRKTELLYSLTKSWTYAEPQKSPRVSFKKAKRFLSEKEWYYRRRHQIIILSKQSLKWGERVNELCKDIVIREMVLRTGKRQRSKTTWKMKIFLLKGPPPCTVLFFFHLYSSNELPLKSNWHF